MEPWTPERIQALSYEEAEQLLEGIARKLEQKQVLLADAMKMQVLAQQVAQRASQLLAEATALSTSPSQP